MTGEDRYIAGVPCWVDTAQPDPEAATKFYGELFGWEFRDVMPAESPLRYYVAHQGGGDIAAIGSQPDTTAGAAWNTYIWVEDADRTATKVWEAGGAVLMEPADVGDAGRMAEFADREGAAFRVWQPKQHRGAAVVNEPVSLNFNDLHTRDLKSAAAFYGAVFGWELLTYDFGSAWALPAYGDFLERRTPGMRQGMAEMGAPDRFQEVLATAVHQPDMPPHWGVTFAVDDADAIAARAAELGATVVVPPVDAPWVRTTVITDPQGATFTANKFVPENRDVAAPATAAAGAPASP
jgi:predicted enzyme related to lactoylglutathione lyase